jgi:molecular chaperone HtpG
MKDMQAIGGGNDYFGSMPETYNLVVNSNHPLIGKLLEEKDEEKQNKLTKQLTDLALLSQSLLKGEELTKFIKRSVDLIE